MCARFLTESSTVQEREPVNQPALLTGALKDLLVIAQDTQCSPETVMVLERILEGLRFDLDFALNSKCPFGHRQASYRRVLLSMALLTRSAVLAYSTDDRDKGRIPDVMVSWPHRTPLSGT